MTALTLKDELMFPSDFLSYVDLKGKPRTVTIEEIWLENLARKGSKRDEKKKVVVRLVGKKKKLVLNRTNCDRLAKVYGGKADEWIGKQIVIQPDKDRFGREMVDCIRVNTELTRKAAGGAALPQVQDLPEEENTSAAGDDFDDDSRDSAMDGMTPPRTEG